jgi:hypothetical protein
MEHLSGDSGSDWDREPTDEEKEAMLEGGIAYMEHIQSGQGEKDLRAIHESVAHADPEVSRQIVQRLMDGREPR